ncbi:unnamed protein product [Protopolystoma xenopodis]|uniref:Fibronectin type-III domain-containing protein n=1 Tax=Protopolystoma xenopodis TaxID=117903 RepID=A0A448WGQ7_9PLAT|nr:unnamed protein product [Protopolystoma xenopodis]
MAWNSQWPDRHYRVFLRAPDSVGEHSHLFHLPPPLDLTDIAPSSYSTNLSEHGRRFHAEIPVPYVLVDRHVEVGVVAGNSYGESLPNVGLANSLLGIQLVFTGSRRWQQQLLSTHLYEGSERFSELFHKVKPYHRQELSSPRDSTQRLQADSTGPVISDRNIALNWLSPVPELVRMVCGNHHPLRQLSSVVCRWNHLEGGPGLLGFQFSATSYGSAEHYFRHPSSLLPNPQVIWHFLPLDTSQVIMPVLPVALESEFGLDLPVKSATRSLRLAPFHIYRFCLRPIWIVSSPRENKEDNDTTIEEENEVQNANADVKLAKTGFDQSAICFPTFFRRKINRKMLIDCTQDTLYQPDLIKLYCTPELPPDNPVDIRLIWKARNAVMLTWRPPTRLNGRLLGYRVAVFQAWGNTNGSFAYLSSGLAKHNIRTTILSDSRERFNPTDASWSGLLRLGDLYSQALSQSSDQNALVWSSSDFNITLLDFVDVPSEYFSSLEKGNNSSCCPSKTRLLISWLPLASSFRRTHLILTILARTSAGWSAGLHLNDNDEKYNNFAHPYRPDCHSLITLTLDVASQSEAGNGFVFEGCNESGLRSEVLPPRGICYTSL